MQRAVFYARDNYLTSPGYRSQEEPKIHMAIIQTSKVAVAQIALSKSNAKYLYQLPQLPAKKH